MLHKCLLFSFLVVVACTQNTNTPKKEDLRVFGCDLNLTTYNYDVMTHELHNMHLLRKNIGYPVGTIYIGEGDTMQVVNHPGYKLIKSYAKNYFKYQEYIFSFTRNKSATEITESFPAIYISNGKQFILIRGNDASNWQNIIPECDVLKNP